jgi:hypothetical protein
VPLTPTAAAFPIHTSDFMLDAAKIPGLLGWEDSQPKRQFIRAILPEAEVFSDLNRQMV